jgi:hypothetical protein
MAKHSPSQYRTWGRQVILEILRTRYVAIWPGIEARAAEREHHPSPLRIDTNHLREAHLELLATGLRLGVRPSRHSSTPKPSSISNSP